MGRDDMTPAQAARFDAIEAELARLDADHAERTAALRLERDRLLAAARKAKSRRKPDIPST